jgi:hypothetical protein
MDQDLKQNWRAAEAPERQATGKRMSNPQRQFAAPCGLVIGAVFGLAGTFVSSASLRGLLWGIDGVALVVAAALLAIYHFRRGNDLVASGYLVFVAGQSLILSTAAAEFAASGSVFGAGASLWSAALILISVPKVMPAWVRGIAIIAALLFLVVGARLFLGHALTPLSEPLPFYAYPFLVATLIGWAWAHYRAAV